MNRKDRNLFITLTDENGRVIFYVNNSMVGYKKYSMRNDWDIIHLMSSLFLKKIRKYKIKRIRRLIAKYKITLNNYPHKAVVNIFVYALKKNGIVFEKLFRKISVPHSTHLHHLKTKKKTR